MMILFSIIADFLRHALMLCHTFREWLSPAFITPLFFPPFFLFIFFFAV